jgi:hypothetical protein
MGDTALFGPFYLNNILITSDIIQNLLSVRRFTTDNLCSMEFNPFGFYMKDLSTRNMITRCDSSGPLYIMRLPSCSTPSSSVAAPIALVASASTWHRRLGHPGIDTMSKLSNASSIICSGHTHDLCHAYQLGHHTHIPFASSASRADNNFDLIYCDLSTSPIVSILILCGLFLCMLNWTLSPHCQKNSLFLHSLATPSKPSSVTTVVSSTLMPPVHSLPLVGSSSRCPIHTPLRRMVKPSVLFAPSIICFTL